METPQANEENGDLALVRNVIRGPKGRGSSSSAAKATSSILSVI